MTVVMDAPTKVAAEAARLAARAGSKVLCNPGVRTRDGLGSLDGIIRRVNTLVLDSNELRNLCRTADVHSAVDRLRRNYPSETIVATLGPAGCLVADGGAKTKVKGVNLAKLGLRAVNSTGSGDAFLGVYSSYTLMGRSPAEAALLANLAGALKATRYETQGSPTRSELESRMQALSKLRRSRQGSPGNRAA